MTDGRFRISNTAVAGGASVTPGVTSASATISTNTRVASGADMSLERLKAGLVTIIVGVAGASAALAADGEVVIGNLDDLSGVYSDDGGPGSVEAESVTLARTVYANPSRSRMRADRRSVKPGPVPSTLSKTSSL